MRWLALIAALSLGADPAVKVEGNSFEKGFKPSGLMPDHWSLAFMMKRGHVDFVPVGAWEKTFAADPKTAAVCVTTPVAALKKALAAGTPPPEDHELPYAGCLDESAPFTVQARRVKFPGGQALLYVTHPFEEEVLASNERLEARFEGLTDDGKTWLGGAVPVRAKGFRDKEGGLVDKATLARQVKADAQLLARLKPSDFTPSLDAIADELSKLQLPAMP